MAHSGAGTMPRLRAPNVRVSAGVGVREAIRDVTVLRSAHKCRGKWYPHVGVCRFGWGSAPSVNILRYSFLAVSGATTQERATPAPDHLPRAAILPSALLHSSPGKGGSMELWNGRGTSEEDERTNTLIQNRGLIKNEFLVFRFCSSVMMLFYNCCIASIYSRKTFFYIGNIPGAN
jgi:hypothetical protein